MAKAPNGSGTTTPDGYRLLTVNGKRKLEHVHIVETVIGKALPKGAVVHHVNSVRNDNRTENLVVCPSHEYHRMIHKREAAFDASGHADWLKCRHCGEYDAPENMYVNPGGFVGRHRTCLNDYQNKRATEKRNFSQIGA